MSDALVMIVEQSSAEISRLRADLAEALDALAELRKHATSSGYDEDKYGDALLRAAALIAKHKPGETG